MYVSSQSHHVMCDANVSQIEWTTIQCVASLFVVALAQARHVYFYLNNTCF